MSTAVLFITALASITASAELNEPHTGAAFDQHIALDGDQLVLTGMDHRRVFGQDAYAIAHYVSEAVAAPENLESPEERLAYYRALAGPKAILLRGVYRKVPARGIRWSWENHFERLGQKPHEEFIEAFQEPFRRGERLYFHAPGNGTLTVYQDAVHLGTWNDPDLVRAFWDMCLGPATEVVQPENLVALPLPKERLGRLDEGPSGANALDGRIDEEKGDPS